MPIFERTVDELTGFIVRDILNNTSITTTAPGTKMRTLIEATSKRLNRAYRTFDANIMMSFVRHAKGKYLDMIGEIFGLERITATKASADANSRIVKFYVENDVDKFGDLNNGNDIFLPAGVAISTQEPTASSSRLAEFELASDTVLNKNLSEQYVSVVAKATGTYSNVGRYQLKYHDFNGIDHPEYLKVINEGAIQNGEEDENDPSFRYRISKQVTAAEAANETSLRLAALSVPGVADVVMLPYHRGIGTLDILIKATTPLVSDSLIAAVQSAVADKAAVGSSIVVRGPDPLALRFEISLYARRILTRAEEDDIANNVKRNLILYVNSLDIGEDFVINEAVQRVMDVSDDIKNMGTASRPFDNVYIGRYRSDQDSFTYSKLVDQNGMLVDYSPEDDERIIVDTASDAITITWPNSPYTRGG